ncbi:Gramicidin S synthase II [Staphylococcus gallinarum]|uniref:Gramicidin S synthase II n=1 Tax=Staphylococcus gallinarum TaxID=1293 RepID=A0A380FAS5_STAGA|nr:Gramicidin S synthase II [Staphylococcus gallinarum]
MYSKTLIERHETLRTHFETIDGEPVQVINDSAEINVEYAEISTDHYETLLDDFVQPFDLSQAPLLKVKIVKVAESRYVLLF